MAFQLSAGVNVSEIDLTTVVPSVATSIGAFAGKFAWGPVNEVVTISNEVQLADRFGKPTNDNFEYWFSAANFLAYSNNLKVVRSANTASSKNATTSGGGVLIENQTDYENNHAAGANTYGEFAAKYPGELGNSIRIEMVDSATYGNWAFAGAFTDSPDTSDYAARAGGENDELHIIVLDVGGKITGSANAVLEKFAFVSKASDAKTFDGSSNYYKDVLNSRSKYVWSLSHPSEGTNWGTAAAGTTFDDLNAAVLSTLVDGDDGIISSSAIANSYSQVSNPDSTDISLIVSGPANASIAEVLIGIAEDRKDCVVFLSPERADVVDNYGSEETAIIAYRNGLSSSSYAVMDSGWKYQYDKYNDVYRWVPLNADIAGLCARTDLERDPWFSPAGVNRGVIKNVVKLSWNPTKANRDNLYTKGVNPVVTFPGEGTVLFGDKTMLSRPSAFDRINVRRLFIVLEKAIARASRSSLFEFNDQFTRAQFVNLVEPFLRDVQGRRGITDFRVVCDETNNTPEIIDRNEFVGDIYIKPARSINFIQLNFVAVRTGIRFEEIVGQFG
jgi:phage tail sheath protein FI